MGKYALAGSRYFRSLCPCLLVVQHGDDYMPMPPKALTCLTTTEKAGTLFHPSQLRGYYTTLGAEPYDEVAPGR